MAFCKDEHFSSLKDNASKKIGVNAHVKSCCRWFDHTYEYEFVELMLYRHTGIAENEEKAMIFEIIINGIDFPNFKL